MKEEKIVLQPREVDKIEFRPSFPGQVGVFLPDVELCFQQNPVSRAQLAELLGLSIPNINLDGEKPEHIPQEQWDRAKQVFDEIYEDTSED